VASYRMRVCLLGVVTLLAACKENGTGPTAPCGMGSTCSGSQQLTSLTLSPAYDTLLVGDKAQITFVASNSSGPVTGVTVAYKSSDTAVAKVDTSGLVSAVGAGATVISIAAGGLTASAHLAVLAPSIVLLSAGADYSCLTLPLGRGYCWGRDDIGQLAAAAPATCFDTASTSTVACALSPVRMSGNVRWTALSTGGQVACGLNTAGSALCWGDNTFGEIGNGGGGGGSTPSQVSGALTFTSIAAGNQHVCGVAASRVFCWGDDDFGQLGDTGIVNSTTPIPAESAGTVMSFVTVTAGFAHTCALKASGAAYCWGNNAAAQLGIGAADGNAHSTPVQVGGGLTFVSLTAGTAHTCGLTSAGVAYCWGDNSFGELGIGSAGGEAGAPVAVGGGLTFTQLSAGDVFTCGVSGSAVYCWGSNSDGQIGEGAGVTGGMAASPSKVSGSLSFSHVTAGKRHACGIVSGGAEAACWGSDIFGTLGNSLQAATSGVPVIVGTPLS
jgi:alpha-tubulin suppressor-like RCC1 family protein